MIIRKICGLGITTLLLAACDSGGVDLNPSNTVSNSNNSTITNPPPTGGGTPAVNPCASFSKSGQQFQGTVDGNNCIYSVSFVSENNPLTVDLSIPELANNGLHIFEDNLWVGEDVNANAAAQGVRIPQDGEGPDLIIAPGAKLAFSDSATYLRIARGSRIIAEGTAAKPIIISGIKDLRDNTATPADRGLWGGVQINGNGITNKCSDADRQPTASNPHNCHVTSEGLPSSYGGTNNAENSGVMRFVQIRHAGFQVVDGDELNGLTLNGVGSATKIEFVQVFTTLDDGFETFGGAVDLKNIVALNVGDDYLDYSEGWTGDIQFALLMQTSGANRCIEADNTGSNRADDVAPFTKARISNMTCIVTDVDVNQGTAPSAKGDAEGPLFREGAYFEMYNSIVTSSVSGAASNECFEVEEPVTIAGITAGFSVASGNVIACSEAIKVSSSAGLDLKAWWIAGGNAVIDTAASLPANLITGLSPANPTAYITAATLTDANAAPINVSVFNVTTLKDNFSAAAVPAVGASGSSSFFSSVDFIGAVKAGQDWVAGWTTGL